MAITCMHAMSVLLGICTSMCVCFSHTHLVYSPCLLRLYCSNRHMWYIRNIIIIFLVCVHFNVYYLMRFYPNRMIQLSVSLYAHKWNDSVLYMAFSSRIIWIHNNTLWWQWCQSVASKIKQECLALNHRTIPLTRLGLSLAPVHIIPYHRYCIVTLGYPELFLILDQWGV